MPKTLNNLSNNINHVENGKYSKNSDDSSKKTSLARSPKTRENSWLDKFRYFYSSPVVKYSYNAIFFGCFLILISITHLSLYGDELEPSELILLLYIVTRLIEEIHQVCCFASVQCKIAQLGLFTKILMCRICRSKIFE